MRRDQPTTGTTTNQNRSQRAETALREALARSLQRGFYGTAGVVVSIQDGVIQNVRLSVDQRVL